MPGEQVVDLEAKVDEAEKRQNAYEETLACVDRLWSQLNQDVVFLAARACAGDCAAPNYTAAAPAPEPCKAGNGAAEPEDPFLERLLRGEARTAAFVRGQAEEIRDNSTDVESALAARAAGTSAALASLVDAIDAARLRAAEAAAHAAQPNGVAAQDELQRLVKEAADARRAADAQKAVNRVLQQRVRDQTASLSAHVGAPAQKSSRLWCYCEHGVTHTLLSVFSFGASGVQAQQAVKRVLQK